MVDCLTLDDRREHRLGFGEAVLCAWKPLPVIAEALKRFRELGRPALFTRLAPEQYSALADELRQSLDYCPVSRTAFLGEPAPPGGEARVAVVTAGSSDLPVALEAARCLAFHGIACRTVHDVGVAGLWRLEAKLQTIRSCPVVIVSAGMDAALVSVLGGLVPGMVIALPTSVGYGVVDGGATALKAALASCAPGVVVVNIDNGYGAAMAAVRVLGAAAQSAAEATSGLEVRAGDPRHGPGGASVEPSAALGKRRL